MGARGEPKTRGNKTSPFALTTAAAPLRRPPPKLPGHSTTTLTASQPPTTAFSRSPDPPLTRYLRRWGREMWKKNIDPQLIADLSGSRSRGRRSCQKTTITFASFTLFPIPHRRRAPTADYLCDQNTTKRGSPDRREKIRLSLFHKNTSNCHRFRLTLPSNTPSRSHRLAVGVAAARETLRGGLILVGEAVKTTVLFFSNNRRLQAWRATARRRLWRLERCFSPV